MRADLGPADGSARIWDRRTMRERARVSMVEHQANSNAVRRRHLDQCCDLRGNSVALEAQKRGSGSRLKFIHASDRDRWIAP